MSDIRNFYANKTIFITGATGFLGQVLLSKLLCSCPEIRQIYILIREKKGKSTHRRITEMFEDAIFSTAKQINPEYSNKVIPIEGDCLLEELGISPYNQILLSEVDVIFHAAADINFDGALQEIAYINVRSIDILLDMAKNMKNLKALVYLSTAFAASGRTNYIEEKFYDPPMKARHLLTMVEQLDKEILSNRTPSLIKPHPNTYIYTKLIAEDLCHDKEGELPVSIFRPSIVSPSYQEPLLGWINNYNGAAGVIAGCATGLLKVAMAGKHCNADIVPCDYTINALIVAAYHTGQQWEKSLANGSKFRIPIFNYSNSNTKLNFTWQKFVDESLKSIHKYPFHHMVSPPSMIATKNPVIFQMLSLVLHTFPAYVLDSILLIFRKNPSTGNWFIPNSNFDQVWLALSEADKHTFYYNLDDLNMEKYCENFVRGVRKFVMKEDEQTIKKAIARRTRLSILHNGFLIVIMLSIAYSLIKFVFP